MRTHEVSAEHRMQRLQLRAMFLEVSAGARRVPPTEQTVHRAQVDDTPRACAHQWQKGLAHPQGSEVVDVDGLLLLREGRMVLIVEDAGIVNQDITTTLLGLDQACETIDGRRLVQFACSKT